MASTLDGPKWRLHCNCPHDVSKDTGSACRASHGAKAVKEQRG